MITVPSVEGPCQALQTHPYDLATCLSGEAGSRIRDAPVKADISGSTGVPHLQGNEPP